MKNLSIFLSVIITALIMSITAAASEKAAIVQTSVSSDMVSAYVNTDVDSCTVQLGAELCDVISCKPAGETETATLILVDASGSVPKEVRSKIAEFLETLIENKKDNESFAVAEFGTDINLLCDYTTDRYDLSKAVEKIAYDEKYTYLYSVLSNQLESLPIDKFGRIILISDGVENSKDGITYDEFIIDVKNSQRMIYTIGFENSNQESLKKLFSFSRQTNASSYTLDEASDVNEICTAINSDRHYTCITAEIPAELADGSVKYLKITGDDFECGADIRTIQLDASKITTSAETNAEITADEATETAVLVSEEKKTDNSIIFIVIPFAAVIVICIAVIAVLANKKKSISTTVNEAEPIKIKETEEKPVKPSEQGRTRMLFDNGRNKSCSETDETVILTENVPSDDKLVIKLTDINNPSKTYRYAVNAGIVIGRNSAESMIAIDDKYVSGTHCRIYENCGKAYVENKSKKNHTYVNDKVIENCLLKNGDIIRIGITSLRFEYVK